MCASNRPISTHFADFGAAVLARKAAAVSHAVTASAEAALSAARQVERGDRRSRPDLVAAAPRQRGASAPRHQPHRQVDDGIRGAWRSAAGRCRAPRPARRSAGGAAQMRRPCARREQHLVVGDQRGKPAAARCTGRSAQARASTCRVPDAPRDQHAAVAERRSAVACMLTGGTRHASAFGRQRHHEARAARRSPGLRARACSRRVSVPPCASTICRLIDRPRPEFWPKASLAGRSV